MRIKNITIRGDGLYGWFWIMVAWIFRDITFINCTFTGWWITDWKWKHSELARMINRNIK